MGLVYRRSIVTPLRFVLLALVASAGLAVINAEKFTVGDNMKWVPNVNYTAWEHKYNNSIHVGDWLVFYYTEGQANVIQVNESAYNKCDATNPISNYSKGRSYAIQLNEARHYYFICSYGYCYGGMKLSVVAHPLPPPPSPPPSIDASPATAVVKPVLGFLVAAAVAALTMSISFSDLIM